jgi:hypothetical protein
MGRKPSPENSPALKGGGSASHRLSRQLTSLTYAQSEVRAINSDGQDRGTAGPYHSLIDKCNTTRRRFSTSGQSRRLDPYCTICTLNILPKQRLLLGTSYTQLLTYNSMSGIVL